MARIWKYPLQMRNEQTIMMPAGAKVLAVQVQDGVPCIWVAVDEREPQTVLRFFRICGTGHEMCEGNYVGTFQLAGGRFVGHLFDGGEP
jgi:hypothetical protein